MRTTKADVEKQKQLILETALTVFKDKGYNGTRVEDIAEAAGISRGPVYYHYKNKSDLFIAAYVYWIDKSMREYEKIYSDDSVPFMKNLCKSFDFSGGKLVNNSVLFFNDIKMLMPDYPAIRDLSANFQNKLREMQIQGVKRGIERGEFKPDTDPELLIDSSYLAFYGITYMYNVQAGEISQEYYKKLVDDYLEMVRLKYCL